ncbi:hypothetical protein EJ110_NYTH20730 [Nymphaea thermarum]|nr:hypothetical protein EJ110_NYTH20730 [Nymphaea thermarum]
MLKESFVNCVLKHKDGGTFECMWTQMIEAYNIQENTSLQNKDKEKVERTHVALQRRLYSCLHISRFMEYYDKFLDGLRDSDLEEDVKAFICWPQSLGITILDRVAAMYTQTAFEWFKEETIQATNCDIELHAQQSSCRVYRVIKRERDSTKINDAFVTYNIETSDVECFYKKFESKDILCCHALKTLNQEKIWELLD